MKLNSIFKAGKIIDKFNTAGTISVESNMEWLEIEIMHVFAQELTHQDQIKFAEILNPFKLILKINIFI